MKLARNHDFLVLCADRFGTHLGCLGEYPAHLNARLFPWVWDVMQRRLITGYRYFKAEYRSHLQGSCSPVRHSFWTAYVTFRQSEELESTAAKLKSA